MPIRSRSTQNASIRDLLADRSRADRPGPDAGRRSRRGRRGRVPSSVGTGSSPRQVGQRSRASRTISERIAVYSRSAASRIRSGVSVSERIVCRILRANRSVRPRRPSPSLVGRTSSVRWRSDRSARPWPRPPHRPAAAAARRRPDLWAPPGLAPRAPRRSGRRPRACSNAVSVWWNGRPGGRSAPTSVSRAPSVTASIALEPLCHARESIGQRRELTGEAGRGHRRAGTPTSRVPRIVPQLGLREPHRVELLGTRSRSMASSRVRSVAANAPNTPLHSSMNASRADGRRLSSGQRPSYRWSPIDVAATGSSSTNASRNAWKVSGNAGIAEV